MHGAARLGERELRRAGDLIRCRLRCHRETVFHDGAKESRMIQGLVSGEGEKACRVSIGEIDEGAAVEEGVCESIGARGHPRTQGREDRARSARELPRDGGHDAGRRLLVAQDERQALRACGFEQLEIGSAAGHPEETLHAGPAQALDEDVGDGGHQRCSGRV